MSNRSYIALTAVPPAAALALLAPAAAHAHALGLESDPNRPAAEYLWLGFLHMVTGWDHLLFIAGVLLIAGGAWTAAKLISLFVVGHSLTLLIASIAGWRLDATFVDVVIALSVVFVGVVGLRGRPANMRPFMAAVFGFGLIHGLGLSTRLQDLGLPDDGLVGRVVLFNIGVEGGQLVALAVFVGIGYLLARTLYARDEPRRLAFASLIAAGLAAAVIISLPSDDEAGERPVAGADGQAAACTERDEQAPPNLAGGHPAKPFYEPREAAPEDDLGHVVGDGYVIVRYRPDLPAEQLDRLRSVTQAGGGSYTVTAPDPDQDVPVRAVTARKTLTCERFDAAALQQFRDRWLDEILGARPG
jgi:hydrogenase/urease accessory protein HupE